MQLERSEVEKQLKVGIDTRKDSIVRITSSQASGKPFTIYENETEADKQMIIRSLIDRFVSAAECTCN